MIPSLIRWTGSKRYQAKQIAELAPTHFNRYFEPFLGGGAVLYALGQTEATASDIYEPLINLWNLFKNFPEDVISNYTEQWFALSSELEGLDRSSDSGTLPKYYYAVRDRFNQTQDPLDLNFLLRTCVNGIVRFNSKKEFNTSFHLSRKGMEPKRFEKNVKMWHKRIEKVNFLCQDYTTTFEMAEKDDFLYLDPPYSNTTQRYIQGLDCSLFFENLEKLNQKGVKWALSFDGLRGEDNYLYPVPEELFKKHILLSNGNSALRQVLQRKVEEVKESLYLNF